ncbi:thioesterase II family protein [Streptomyces sp. NPDC088789]|uniref:thioesterase II family protein n=1 Tax=Streptomyces sp. NPDC088789 TaxID=3365899 RepID=UPI0037F9870F
MPRREPRRRGRPEWLYPLRRAAGRPRARLVVFPYAAAGATALRPVLTGLPDEVELLGVALPGRERRFGEPPASGLDGIVDAVAAELAADPSVPTSVFGHCMGAGMALVLAQTHPRLVRGAVVSGRNPPGAPRSTSPDMDDADIIAFLESAGNTAPELLADAFWRDKLLELFRGDAALGEQASQVIGARPLGQDLLVLGGGDDPYVDPRGLSGWAARTSGRCEVLVLPGDHFFVIDPPNIPVITRALGDLVLDAPASTGGDSGGSPRVGRP